MVREHESNGVGIGGDPVAAADGPGTPAAGNRAGVRRLVDRARALAPWAERANAAFVTFVRAQPAVALGVAAAIGYLSGRLLRRLA